MSTKTEDAKPASDVDFATAAARCGRKVLISLMLLVAALTALGYGIEHRYVIGRALLIAWDAVLYGVSLGGHYWGAVGAGVLGMALFAWGLCIGNSLPEKASHTGVVNLCLFGLFLWILSSIAINGLYQSFSDLTVFEAIGQWVLFVPFGVAIGAFICGLASVVANAP